MTTQDEGSLPTELTQRAANNEKLTAEIFELEFIGANDLNDEAFRLTDLERICRAVFDKFDVPDWYSPEDHFQDVSIRFWKSLMGYRGEAKLSTVAYSIAFNQLVDRVRRQWREDADDEDDFIAKVEQQLARKQNSNTTADRADKRILMKELSGSLSDAESRLIREYYVLGKTTVEISSETGVTPQAVQKRLKRAVKKMKLTLGEEGRAPNAGLRHTNGTLAV